MKFIATDIPGMIVIEPQVVCKCADFYDPEGQISVQWNDSDMKIDWPLEEIHSPILSKKDIAAKPLRQLMDVLPWFE